MRALQPNFVENPMSEPANNEAVVAARVPAVLELEPGEYWWCQCGRSSNQPWCDGSHAGTEFSPMKVEIDTKKKCALCQCKATATGPFCDGSHKRV